MRFEQAYYTRGKNLLNECGTGLGIAAASNVQNSFFAGAMSVGSKFNTEKSKEPAEFLIYSEYFQRYVGVRVSPSFAADGGNVNKLCHMFIPEKEERNPDLYCMDYPYEYELPSEKYLEKSEIGPCLAKSDFARILKKYEFDTEKLASFLQKLYPVMFGEKNQLLIVPDEKFGEKDGFTKAAKEIAWLANYLVPMTGEEAWEYRKNLSYGVNTADNTEIVNLVFSSDQSLSDHRFFLGGDGLASEELQPLYRELAKTALSSYEEFEEFVMEIHNGGPAGKIGSRELQMKYLMWKFTYDLRVEPKEIPVTMEFVRREAVKNKLYQQFLFYWILAMEEISLNELVRIWQQVIEIQLKEEMYEAEELFLEVIMKLLKLMYHKSVKNYRIILKRLPDRIRRKILKPMMEVRDSCIWDHVRRLTSFEECQEVYEIYDITGEGAALSQQMAASCTNIMNEIMQNADRRTVISYIKLELLREELLSDEFESTVQQRCQNLDRLALEAPEFYEKLVNAAVYIERIPVMARVKEARIYDRLLKRKKVSEDTLRESSELLFEARERLGNEIEPVRILEEEYEDLIEKLECEKEEYTCEIQRKQYQKLENEGEIVRLKKENHNLESEIEAEKTVCERLKRALRMSKEILMNGK